MTSACRIVALCVLFSMLAVPTSRGDFSWTQGQGPPGNLQNYKCVPAAACSTAAGVCTAVNATVDGVNVQSYSTVAPTPYGSCTSNNPNQQCTSYPNVPCATVQIFTQPGCLEGYYNSTITVYSGSCTPPNNQ